MFERIAALHADRAPDWAVHVHLIDAGEPGQGAHSSFQPDHLLTNTVAGQITMFTDPSVRNAGPIKPGPTLLEWARSVSYRRVDGRFVRTHSDGQDIHEGDYLPRAMLGEYLSYVYDLLASSLPRNVHLTHHRRMVEDIEPLKDGRLRVVVAGGFSIIADCVVMTTGHSESCVSRADEILERQVQSGTSKNPKLGYLNSVYPISCLKSICSDATVAIQGMGLTTYDVVSELTVGRGGTFASDGSGRLKYKPSGREPHMVLYSRQGVPFAARGINQKGIAGLHRPVFFTRPWIDDLRRHKMAVAGSAKLDFDIDLWPMLKKEMCFVYDATRSGTSPDPASYMPSVASELAITEIYAPLGAGRFENQAEFNEVVRRHIEWDLAHALEGNVRSPVKAATDVLRDVRDYIRYAVDYGGLTEESHKRFLNEVIPVMYRVSAGGPKERNMQLLALLDAGIASFGPGPNPELSFDGENARFALRSTRLAKSNERHVDVVVRARIDCTVYPEKQKSPLIRNMLRSGALRPYTNGSFVPGGIDVDDSQNVISASGEAHANLWALGIIVEGPNWCTYVLPRALVNSRFLQFSGRCALKIFALLDARHARLSTARDARELSAAAAEAIRATDPGRADGVDAHAGAPVA
jgi:uncharacterized NAD(P)/FAD-binding protein YdhS